jgi:hypothetical protein
MTGFVLRSKNLDSFVLVLRMLLFILQRQQRQQLPN